MKLHEADSGLGPNLREESRLTSQLELWDSKRAACNQLLRHRENTLQLIERRLEEIRQDTLREQDDLEDNLQVSVAEESHCSTSKYGKENSQELQALSGIPSKSKRPVQKRLGALIRSCSPFFNFEPVRSIIDLDNWRRGRKVESSNLTRELHPALATQGYCPICELPNQVHCRKSGAVKRERELTSAAFRQLEEGEGVALAQGDTTPVVARQVPTPHLTPLTDVDIVFSTPTTRDPTSSNETSLKSIFPTSEPKDQTMALQTSSPAIPTSLSPSSDSTRRQYPNTPQQQPTGYSSQPSSGATVRQSMQNSPKHGMVSAEATFDPSRPGGPPVQPPPRTSSTQNRSQSLALATDAQLADRTRAKATTQAPSSSSSRVAHASSSHADSHAGYQASRPTDMSRGNSEVISKVVIDDPKNDLQREQARVAEALPDSQPRTASMPPSSTTTSQDSSKPTMKRQDFSATAGKRKEARLGDYILGQTLGEGEFGKVKLGWKKDGSVQVAVKLIRRENLNTNPSRLPKIYREISILGQLSHPNIVKLHEMVETERYIGIILEYASGGELFDYILTHRYLKDNAARRLFAQLVSGVGYLHKKGIVHRDLKLENLLLDRNRNLMISDFGFANTFDPRDELGEEVEGRITDKDFVKKNDLERIHRNGFRRGDLMQTSCGSPCYAAPELVVSDSLYTGRKVDVWSCGVILYAMLAGYLPFDDDPANPEGDNINLLYKYICNTPLTFPEYVTPHARDLLRRILVPDPRKRADLFEVARHSWLSEYSHVVEHITSTTTTIDDISSAAPLASGKKPSSRPREWVLNSTGDQAQAPSLVRSASVREPAKPPAQVTIPQQGKAEAQTDKASSPRDPKRRTVQLEYVAPKTQTARGESSPVGPESIGMPSTIPAGMSRPSASESKPLPQDPPVGQAVTTGAGYQRSTLPASVRAGRDIPTRAVTESGGTVLQSPTRPTTGNSLSSNSAGRLPSRGNSYSQPLAPTVAAMSASGRIQQPKSRQYTISGPVPQPEPYIADDVQRPVSQRMQPVRKTRQPVQGMEGKGHKRSTTLGNIFSRTNSLFGSNKTHSPSESPKPDRRYPPVSMKNQLQSDSPRPSLESRTRPSFGVSRKTSGSDVSNKPEKSRRFSLIPGFNLKGFGNSSNKESNLAESRQIDRQQPQRGATSSGPPGESVESMSYNGAQQIPPRSAPQQIHAADAYGSTNQYDNYVSRPISNSRARPNSQMQHSSSGYMYGTSAPAEAQLSTSYPTTSRIPQSSTAPQLSQVSQSYQDHSSQPTGRYPAGFNEYDGVQAQPSSGAGRHLQKNNRRFADGYEDSGNGSSGAARRVMDFFRRRGKARAGEGQ